MSTSVALKKETETTTCGYCNTQNSVFVMCVGYHLACQACRDEFRICPICFGDYLPFDDVRMKTMVKPDGKAPNKMNINPARIRSVAPIVQSATYVERKKAIDKCKHNFFMGVCDSVISSLLSPRSTSFRQFLGSTIAKIGRRMGRSLLNVAAVSNKASAIFPTSIGLLLLLIISQISIKKGWKISAIKPTTKRG